MNPKCKVVKVVRFSDRWQFGCLFSKPEFTIWISYDKAENNSALFLLPSFSLPDLLCDPTDPMH